MRKTVETNFQRLHKVLLSLGYRGVKENHYRREAFHIILHPKNGRVDVSIHVDKLTSWSPSFKHHSRQIGKDIAQEYRNIMRSLKK